MFKIQKANLNWRNTGWVKLNPNNVEGIALHHMAHPTADLKTVHNWHLNQWKSEPGCGYNYWIDFNGNIFECRGGYRGAHVGGKNSSLLGIGFQGNYHPVPGMAHRTSMPDAQFNAGVWLIKELQKHYTRAKRVHGHNHWGSTACPGQYFPLVEMIAGKYRGINPINQLEEDLKILQQNGIINSPEYWKANAKDGGIVNGTFAAQLIHNMANKLRK